MAQHFAAPPPVVDDMELWQVVACLTPEQRDDPESLATTAAPGFPGQRPTMRAIDIIKARYAARDAGEPDPDVAVSRRLLGLPT
jgi:hypothetical protein